jgi:tRNA wybutosine-synthesizing protein 4
MMAHFDKLQTPLRAVQRYPSTTAQCERFKYLGWPIVSACNLWELWGSSGFASISERKELDKIEPFDEWEEFALFGCHYFLLVANTISVLPVSQTLGPKSSVRENQSMVSGNTKRALQFQLSYEDCAKARGRNRFAAALHIRGQRLSGDAMGVFGGMGLVTRINSVDVYTNDESSYFPLHIRGDPTVPSSRMCHTIISIGDEGALLVGGRTSPDNALADCWVFHKWYVLDSWVLSLRAVEFDCSRAKILRVHSLDVNSNWMLM